MENTDVHKIYEKYSCLLIDEKLPKSKEISLTELGCLAKNFESFLSAQLDVSCNQNYVVPKLVELIVNFGLVKTFDGYEDRDFDSRDFPCEAENAELCFEFLSCLFVQFENIDTSSKRKCLIQVLLLCATHSSKFLWSNDRSVALGKDFLKNLLLCTKYKSLSMVLPDETFHPTIFKAILKLMRPSLMKDTWMKNPSSCHVFYWVLSHVKHPHLVDYLPDVLPPSFMFSSYYVVPQQVLGIKCFHHILDNVPPSLIKADGTEEAIFDILKKFLYSKEIKIVEVLYPCLLKLPMMNVQRVNQTVWLQFDIVLQQLLQNIDLESDPKTRCMFLSQALLFIKITPCFKHLKKALRILYQNLTANSELEEECRIISLELIKELIKSCWPRMEHHCFDIILAILKVICDTEDPNNFSKDTSKVINLCENCLSMLKHSCPETFQMLINEYLQEDDLPGATVLKCLLET